jgi:hypothetical protein
MPDSLGDTAVQHAAHAKCSPGVLGDTTVRRESVATKNTLGVLGDTTAQRAAPAKYPPDVLGDTTVGRESAAIN